MPETSAAVAKKVESEMKTAPVRTDAGIAKKAKIAAEHQGIDLSVNLSALLKVSVEKEWGRARKAILES